MRQFNIETLFLVLFVVGTLYCGLHVFTQLNSVDFKGTIEALNGSH